MTSLAHLRRLFAFRSSAGSPSHEDSREASGVTSAAEPSGTWRPSRQTRLLGLTPFAVALGMDLLIPGYFVGLFQTPPDIVGYPFFIVLHLAFLAWAGLGAVVLWQTRFRIMAALALTACTAVAIAGILLEPWLIRLFVMM